VDLLYAEEMVIAEMKNGETIFRNVDLFSRPALREMLESGEITLGEAWYQGDLGMFQKYIYTLKKRNA
jgi:hypothetical protein